MSRQYFSKLAISLIVVTLFTFSKVSAEEQSIPNATQHQEPEKARQETSTGIEPPQGKRYEDWQKSRAKIEENLRKLDEMAIKLENASNLTPEQKVKSAEKRKQNNSTAEKALLKMDEGMKEFYGIIDRSASLKLSEPKPSFEKGSFGEMTYLNGQMHEVYANARQHASDGESISLAKRALELAEKFDSINGLYVATALLALGELYRVSKTSDSNMKALPLLERAFELHKVSLGLGNERTLQALYSLAATYEAKGERAKAIQLRLRAQPGNNDLPSISQTPV